MLSRLVRKLFQTDPAGRRPQGKRPVRYRPYYELLEKREVPATFTVTSLADSGAGTLRDAILQADNHPGEENTINIAVHGTIALDSALPNVTVDTDILGPGAALLTIQRNTAAGTRNFGIFTNSVADNDLDIFDVTIVGGNAPSLGGAITNWGCLCVTNCTITGNTASAFGGAIYSGGAMLQIEHSVFTNNSADAGGGAVYAQFSDSTIDDSVFADNTSTTGGSIYQSFGSLAIDSTTFTDNSAIITGAGGAIYNAHTPLTITNSTFAGNSAVLGGALFIAGFQGDTLNCVNCTFVGNSAQAQGGAIYNGYFSFQGTISSSTIAGNEVASTGNGGGIFVGAGTGSLVLFDSIVAGNTRGTGADATSNDIEGDLSAPSLSAYNIIGDGSLTNLGYGVNGNIVGTAANPINPLLGPLQDNGGPTPTMALLPGSPALNAGSTANAPPTDQRGLPRLTNGLIDIGAYQHQANPINQAPTVANPASSNPGIVTGTTASLAVLGADDGGEGNLTYAWATTGTVPAPVTLSANGTNAAKNTSVTFARAGTYTFQATITDSSGLSVTSDVTVTVNQTLTSIGMTPGSATISAGGTQQFTATGWDQFGDVITAQPNFAWSLVGGGIGTLSSTGLYTAPTTVGGLATVQVTSGVISASASVTVTAPVSQGGINWDTLTGGSTVPDAFRSAIQSVFPAGGTASLAGGLSSAFKSTYLLMGMDAQGREFEIIASSLFGGPITTAIYYFS